MRRALATVLLLLALPASASTVTVQTAPPAGEIEKMVNAERAFAKKALDTNIRDAFYENMDDEAILFRPTPVNAKEYFQGRPANPGPVLAWYPSYAELSGSGDLGWTMGPWAFRSAKDKAPEAFGHFATVWRRQQNGGYKVLMDEGHSCAQPPQDSLTWAIAPGKQAAGSVVDLSSLVKAQRSLMEVDAAYSKLMAEKGIGAALAQYGDDDVRLLREEKPLIQGPSAAAKALEHEWDGGVEAWDMKPGAISQVLDLAFTYGIATMGEKAKDSPNGRKVFRVWRRNPEVGDWKVALDVTNPVPPPPPAPKKP
jgi:ketosteroid isomerase-like protein